MLEINTSKIKNTVTFTVDKQSLKEAKDAIKSVKTFAEGLQPTINLSKIKRQMKEVEAYARHLQKNMPKYNGGTPGTPLPTPGGVPPQSGGQKPPKQTSEQKAALRAAKRNETANLKMENFGYRASQFSKADTASLEQARKIVEQTVDLYRQEKISLQRVNQTMSHQLDSLRRSHREKVATVEDEVRGRRRVRRELEAEAKLRIRIRERERKDKERAEKRDRDAKQRDRARRYDRVREGAFGLNPTMIASSLLGAGVIAGISQLQSILSQSAERTNMVSRGAQNVQTNPNAILAFEAWGRVNGVDSANIIKAIDNIKDVRERLGNSAMMSELDPKDGKWKKGDSGINDIMNQFGWNKEQIAKFQNRPLDFIQATVNEGQRRGMNSAQIGRLMENLGDDLMHYQRMFLDNGKEYMEMVMQLTRTGGALNEEQIKAAQHYVVMSEKLNQFSNGFSASMLQGFMEGMKGAPDFSGNVKQLNEAAIGLGKSLGDLTVGFMKMANWTLDFMQKYGPRDKSPAGIKKYYEGGSADSDLVTAMGGDSATGFLSWLFGTKSVTDQPLGSYNPSFLTNPLTPNPYSFAGDIAGVNASMMTPQNQYPIPLSVQNTLTIPDNAFQINIIPDGYGFNNYLDARFNAFGSSYTQSMTLQMSSGQSSTGG